MLLRNTPNPFKFHVLHSQQHPRHTAGFPLPAATPPPRPTCCLLAAAATRVLGACCCFALAVRALLTIFLARLVLAGATDVPRAERLITEAPPLAVTPAPLAPALVTPRLATPSVVGARLLAMPFSAAPAALRALISCAGGCIKQGLIKHAASTARRTSFNFAKGCMTPAQVRHR